MIQLLRHQFSRKRAKLFERRDNELDSDFQDVLDDYAEMACDAQVDMLAKNKAKTRMDKHLADVFKSIERLAPANDNLSDQTLDDYKEFTVEDAFNLEKKIDEQIQALSDSISIDDEREPEDSEQGNSSTVLGCDIADKQGFFNNMSQDQIDAGRYLLNKLDKRYQNNQVLMLLHGSPGTGKSFFIKRIKECTSVKLKITATSGIAAMSINGSTIDWLIDKRYESKYKKGSDRNYTRVENINKKLGDATLLIIDEISMMGCSKFTEVDEM